MSDTMPRSSQPEPFLRGCAWPPGPGVAYPRCDPGPAGLRLPADTRAVAAIPVGVRFVFLGEPTALEVDYRTETSDLGYRGEGEGDAQLRLVPGRDLVPEAHLPDGIHPDDDGHRLIAEALAPVLAEAICQSERVIGGRSPPAAEPDSRVGLLIR